MKKNILNFLTISILLFLPSYISGQVNEFDDSFLKSLPEDVRMDLLQAKSDKEDSEEVQYRRPSTYINKPLDQDVNTSDRFGAKIFTMMQSTLMPVNEPNFDGSYILDFGDVLEIQLTGQKSLISRMPIKRDGSISIEDIGKIFISGLSLEAASEIIKNKISLSYIGVDSYITLVNVRDIQIIVAGNVYNPGPYTLNGNSNIFHALSVSGGPSDVGSYRSISLIRGNDLIEEVDLYNTFIYGRSSFKTRLRSGDVVFVKSVTNLVSISGGVRREGVYELKNDEKLSRIIEFADGITNKADLSQIKLFRLSGGAVLDVKIEDITELNKYVPNDNDKVIIRQFPYRSVSIVGAVENPGKYIINQGDGILDIVQRAGGYTETAYPFGGVLENKNTQKINEMAVSELYTAFLNSISSGYSASQSESFSGIISIMEELKKSPVSGRVSAEFSIKKLKENPELDISLQDGDSITIPEVLDHVYIYGEVSSQGTVRYQDKKGYKHYVDLKGGYGPNADQRAVFILQPNGETIRASGSSRNIFMGRSDEALNIYPGSVIFVPRKTSNALATTQTAQAYATILGNIGVSLASISVLKD